MKLRRLFPAAALGLLVCVASAATEEPADEDSRRELIYSFGGVAASAGKETPMSETLLRYAEASDPNHGWPDSVSYRNDGEPAPANGALGEYDFSGSLDDGSTESLGVVRFVGNDNELILSGNGATASVDSSSDKAPYSILYFEKKAYRNPPNTIRFMSEMSISENPDDDGDEELLIAPLSLPFAMFAMGLGIGFFLVLYTSRTKN